MMRQISQWTENYYKLIVYSNFPSTNATHSLLDKKSNFKNFVLPKIQFFDILKTKQLISQENKQNC